jgi:16S rRNA C1402 (ribose-2'-O) methylase RsmI
MSIESKLIDIMVKENCSMKEAIDLLSKNDNISKKEVYNASLNIKKLV